MLRDDRRAMGTMRGWAEEMLEGLNPDALYVDGLDEAIIGVSVGQPGMEAVVIYDEALIIETLMSRGIEDVEGAWEYYEFNVSGGYHGPHTPIIIRRRPELEREAAGEAAELER
jgi:hypothetical protein